MGEHEEFYTHNDLVRIVLVDQGSNNPSIVTRVNRLEICRLEIEEDVEALKAYNRAQETKKDTKQNLILAALLSLIAGLALAHFKII